MPDQVEPLFRTATIVAVHRSPTHEFSKRAEPAIVLQAGLGVEGDAHNGVTVKHRSRVARNPNQPNVRQVHLMHAELFEELAEQGFVVAPGDLGENITTRGIDLLSLPQDTRLRFPSGATVQITGLRNPCVQIDRFQSGLLSAVAGRADDGSIVRRTGVMSIVLTSGVVAPGDEIAIELPAEPHVGLSVV